MESNSISITLIGGDDILAAILAEQAATKAAFVFHAVKTQSEANAQSDVWLFDDVVAQNITDASPLCIAITTHEHSAHPYMRVFQKPLMLAQLLDACVTGARLRRLKQPRMLGAQHRFLPFARSIQNTHNDQHVVLTEKEASFLCAVLDAGDKGVSREAALKELWGYHPDVESHAVETTLYRLRQKMEGLGLAGTALTNLHGIYYWKI